MKLVSVPLTFISYVSIVIVKLSKAIHLIIFPLPLVEPSFLIIESPFAVSHTVIDKSTKLSSILIDIFSILTKLLRELSLNWLLFEGLFFWDGVIVFNFGQLLWWPSWCIRWIRIFCFSAVVIILENRCCNWVVLTVPSSAKRIIFWGFSRIYKARVLLNKFTFN